MKKKFLTTMAILGFSFANSQTMVFNHQYSDFNKIGNGVNLNTTGQGYLMAGTTSPGNPTFTTPGLTVVRTNLIGGISGPPNIFNESYSFITPGNRDVSITGSKIIEYVDGSGYGVICSYYHNPTPTSTVRGIMYVKLDLTGNVINVQSYQAPPFYTNIDISATFESTSSPGDIFATGQAEIGTDKYIWSMRISSTGALLWGNFYFNAFSSEAIPADIIESRNNPELIIVGSINLPLGNTDGFRISINPTTGAFFTANRYDNGGIDHFKAIIYDNTNGYVLCGSSNAPSLPNPTMWALNIDQTFAVVWNNIYEYPDMVSSSLNDVSLYQNQAVNYYLTGNTIPIGGNLDVVGLKLDVNGIATGLYRYDNGGDESGVSVDVKNMLFGDGAAHYVYDVDAGGVPRFNIIKTDVNLKNDCNDIELIPNTKPLPIGVGVVPGGIMATFFSTTIWPNTKVSNNDNELCTNYVYPPRPENITGVKNLMANQSQLSAWPSPFNNELSINAPSKASVTVMDAAGRIVLQIEKTEGTEVKLNTTDWSKGIYTIRLKDESQQASYIKVLK